MFTDTHCHPYDLSHVFEDFEQDLIRHGVLAVSNAACIEEFAYNKNLAHNLLQSFAIHPQLPHVKAENGEAFTGLDAEPILETLFYLAKTGELDAVGECGFDLYNDIFKETEKIQDMIFAEQIEIAIKCGLPVIIHVRRAMHKIFAAEKKLAKCKAVIFHSWPGTLEEGQALLRHGMNVYFSFGNTIMLNHKKAARSCALLPAERILTETDAPYQPRRGKVFSRWTDLPLIIEAAAKLRTDAGNSISADKLEAQVEANFRSVFSNQRL